MSHLWKFIADALFSGFEFPERVSRWSVVLAMGIAGVCFLAFAGIAAAKMDAIGITLALLLVGLAALSFWLAWRRKRS